MLLRTNGEMLGRVILNQNWLDDQVIFLLLSLKMLVCEVRTWQQRFLLLILRLNVQRLD